MARHNVGIVWLLIGVALVYNQGEANGAAVDGAVEVKASLSDAASLRDSPVKQHDHNCYDSARVKCDENCDYDDGHGCDDCVDYYGNKCYECSNKRGRMCHDCYDARGSKCQCDDDEHDGCEDNNDDDADDLWWVILLGVLGGIALLVLLIVLIVCCCCRDKKVQSQPAHINVYAMGPTATAPAEGVVKPTVYNHPPPAGLPPVWTSEREDNASAPMPPPYSSEDNLPPKYSG